MGWSVAAITHHGTDSCRRGQAQRPFPKFHGEERRDHSRTQRKPSFIRPFSIPCLVREVLRQETLGSSLGSQPRTTALLVRSRFASGLPTTGFTQSPSHGGYVPMYSSNTHSCMPAGSLTGPPSLARDPSVSRSFATYSHCASLISVLPTDWQYSAAPSHETCSIGSSSFPGFA